MGLTIHSSQHKPEIEMTQEQITAGKKTYRVISREQTPSDSGFFKFGWVSIVIASFGETIFCIYEHKNGSKKVLRAFV